MIENYYINIVNILIITRALRECPEKKLPIIWSKDMNIRIQRVEKIKQEERDRLRVGANSLVFSKIIGSELSACLLSCFSRVRLCATLWTATCQAPLSMGFSRQEYWSRLPCPPPGDKSDPGIELESLISPALADRFFTTSTTWKARVVYLRG